MNVGEIFFFSIRYEVIERGYIAPEVDNLAITPQVTREVIISLLIDSYIRRRRNFSLLWPGPIKTIKKKGHYTNMSVHSVCARVNVHYARSVEAATRRIFGGKRAGGEGAEEGNSNNSKE